jgi:hypothetical protein
MSANALRRTRPSGDLAQTGVVALLLALAAMTWALTHRRMAGMDAGPGSDLGGLGWFAATWALMMAAMMLPAVAPMVAAYRGRTAGLGATPGLRGRLFDRLARGRPVRLRAGRGRPLARARIPRLGRGGALTGGKRDLRRRAVPADRPEGCVSASLPRPAGVPWRALAPGPRGCPADGGGARQLLRGLLLEVHGGPLRPSGS